MYQGNAAGLVIGVQHADQALQPFCVHAGAYLDADGVGNAAEVLYMRAIDAGSAHADPGKMRRQVVPALTVFEKTRLRLLVGQMQSFVAGVDVCPLRLMQRTTGNRLQEIQ